MTDEIDRIVAGLNEDGRAAFARSADHMMHPTNAGRISTYGDVDVGAELHRLGLIEKPGTFSCATPRGLAVRDRIKENERG